MEFNGYSDTEDEAYKIALEKLICCDKSSSLNDWKAAAEGTWDYRRYFFRDDPRLPSKIWTLVHHLAHILPAEEIVDTVLGELRCMLCLKDGEDRLPSEHLPSVGLSDAYRERFQVSYQTNTLADDLPKIEENFHKLIRKRAKEFGVEAKLAKAVLPNISILLSEYFHERAYFEVPGMYGGFGMKLVWNDTGTGVEGLKTESFCRISQGSGREHLCTAQGYTLVEKIVTHFDCA